MLDYSCFTAMLYFLSSPIIAMFIIPAMLLSSSKHNSLLSHKIYKRKLTDEFIRVIFVINFINLSKMITPNQLFKSTVHHFIIWCILACYGTGVKIQCGTIIIHLYKNYIKVMFLWQKASFSFLKLSSRK